MSSMSREEKIQIVENLKVAFSKSNIGILTDYRGLTNLEMTTLRRRLQQSGGEYKVVKNTLARLAATKAGKDNLVNALEGPIAIAFGYGDISVTPKVLTGYITESKSKLSVKGGFLGDRLLTSEEVGTLSKLPSKEILVARVIGQMQSPISALVGCLAAPIRGVMWVLQARIRQLEGE
ncbi:MAG: 50S ribosomal protein L10 [Dehalococcoidales bacterium]|nr:50S ribosomal protein L10 [Dehalococcoidales bacterium]